MGKVIVQIEGGNLTQDNKIIFIPNSEKATYTYYNTTEIEFEDGNLSYFGETITNSKEDKGATEANFDSQGFLRVKLNPEDSYSNGDFSLMNTGEDTLILCKEDPFCDINLEKEEWKMQGRLNLSYQGKIFYISQDANNEASYNIQSKTFTFSQSQISEGTAATFSSGHFLFLETQETLLYYPLQDPIVSPVESYISKTKNISLTLTEDAFTTEKYTAFSPENKKGESCYENPTSFC